MPTCAATGRSRMVLSTPLKSTSAISARNRKRALAHARIEGRSNTPTSDLQQTNASRKILLRAGVALRPWLAITTKRRLVAGNSAPHALDLFPSKDRVNLQQITSPAAERCSTSRVTLLIDLCSALAISRPVARHWPSGIKNRAFM